MKYNPIFDVSDGRITVTLGDELHKAPDATADLLSLELSVLRNQRDKLATELLDVKAARLEDRDKVLKYNLIYKVVEERGWY